MRLSYKYRLYPNKDQRAALARIFYYCKDLYNGALEERISYYKRYGKGTSYVDQAAQMSGILEGYPQLKEVHSQVRQAVLKQVDTAFKNFFRRIKSGTKAPGFPRYKSMDRFHSILFPQPDPQLSRMNGVKISENQKYLHIFGITEPIRLKKHRPWQGRCKQAIIVKDGDQYYLVLSCDEVPLNPLPKTNKDIGIDLGLNTFIVGDDGLQIHHPKPLKRQKDRLIKAQKELSRKKRGSKNRYRAKQRLARIHRKIRNIRSDFLHKVALQLVQNYDRIIMEKLNIQNLMEEEDPERNKDNIADAGWGIFTNMILYKAEKAGREVILIDPKNTSKTCRCCGYIKKDLRKQDRVFECPHCGHSEDRDLNASKNIKAKGLGMSLAAPL